MVTAIFIFVHTFMWQTLSTSTIAPWKHASITCMVEQWQLCIERCVQLLAYFSYDHRSWPLAQCMVHSARTYIHTYVRMRGQCFLFSLCLVWSFWSFQFGVPIGDCTIYCHLKVHSTRLVLNPQFQKTDIVIVWYMNCIWCSCTWTFVCK